MKQAKQNLLIFKKAHYRKRVGICPKIFRWKYC